MFHRRRTSGRRPASTPPSDAALIAASAVFANANTDTPIPSAAAAAAAALRNASPAPTRETIGNIQTKRMLARKGSYSLSPGSSPSPMGRMKPVRRSSSSASLTQRQLRSQGAGIQRAGSAPPTRGRWEEESVISEDLGSIVEEDGSEIVVVRRRKQRVPAEKTWEERRRRDSGADVRSQRGRESIIEEEEECGMEDAGVETVETGEEFEKKLLDRGVVERRSQEPAKTVVLNKRRGSTAGGAAAAAMNGSRVPVSGGSENVARTRRVPPSPAAQTTSKRMVPGASQTPGGTTTTDRTLSPTKSALRHSGSVASRSPSVRRAHRVSFSDDETVVEPCNTTARTAKWVQQRPAASTASPPPPIPANREPAQKHTISPDMAPTVTITTATPPNASDPQVNPPPCQKSPTRECAVLNEPVTTTRTTATSDSESDSDSIYSDAYESIPATDTLPSIDTAITSDSASPTDIKKPVETAIIAPPPPPIPQDETPRPPRTRRRSATPPPRKKSALKTTTRPPSPPRRTYSSGSESLSESDPEPPRTRTNPVPRMRTSLRDNNTTTAPRTASTRTAVTDYSSDDEPAPAPRTTMRMSMRDAPSLRQKPLRRLSDDSDGPARKPKWTSRFGTDSDDEDYDAPAAGGLSSFSFRKKKAHTPQGMRTGGFDGLATGKKNKKKVSILTPTSELANPVETAKKPAKLQRRRSSSRSLTREVSPMTPAPPVPEIPADAATRKTTMTTPRTGEVRPTAVTSVAETNPIIAPETTPTAEITVATSMNRVTPTGMIENRQKKQHWWGKKRNSKSEDRRMLDSMHFVPEGERVDRPGTVGAEVPRMMAEKKAKRGWLRKMFGKH